MSDVPTYLQDIPQSQHHLVWVDGRQHKDHGCHVDAAFWNVVGQAGGDISMKSVAPTFIVAGVILKGRAKHTNVGFRQEMTQDNFINDLILC